MRLNQSTADHTYWSAAESRQSEGWADTFHRVVRDTDPWVLAVAAGVVALAVLVMVYLTVRGMWRETTRIRKARAATRERVRTEQGEQAALSLTGMGRQGVAALGGVVVSLYGLWGFGRDTAELPFLIRIGFVAMFDVLELLLFSQLYKQADPKKGWTLNLKLLHHTAWAFVAVSAVTNWMHAPNIASAPVLALMPIGAAWVIELGLRARMTGSEKVETGGKAGPLKLLTLLWAKGWTGLFTSFGLDVAATNSQIAKASTAKRAARRLFKLRVQHEIVRTLKEETQFKPAKKQRALRRANRKLETLRRKANVALDNSEFATDSHQALAVMRGLAGWTRVDDIARVPTSKSKKVTTLMEQVAILPSARRIEAAERAAEADAERERAETARDEAEAARQRAEGETRAALEQKERAEAARQAAETAMQEAAEKARAARQDMQRAETARDEAEAARQRAEGKRSEQSESAAELAKRSREEQERLAQASAELQQVAEETARIREAHGQVSGKADEVREQVQKLERERRQAQEQAQSAEEQARSARSQLTTLQARTEAAARELRERTEAVERAADLQRTAERAQETAAAEAHRMQAEAREAAELLDSLRPQLAERVGGVVGSGTVTEGPVFKSEDKQLGWMLYLEDVTAGREAPTATRLAREFSIDQGNARNWLKDFKTRRAEMLIQGGARQARGTVPPQGAGPSVPRAARDEPRGGRAQGDLGDEEAAHTDVSNGHRQPV